ncbi:MAG: endonuclease, partial [Solirubrobacteraceae bacterium]|nr:endonuclease [Solirubrobacteraceae bacterium]
SPYPRLSGCATPAEGVAGGSVSASGRGVCGGFSVRRRTYVLVMEGRIPPRLQGDLGEQSAVDWLRWEGYWVYLPLGHSPHIDMIAVDGEARPLRIQVKTSTQFHNGRWTVAVCTRGGNRSWNGIVKHLDPSQIDYLFVLVGDGRRWFIPAAAIGGGSCVLLGGPKYAGFEVDAGRSLLVNRTSGPLPFCGPAGFRSGQTGSAVNRVALPSQVRILPPPS